jgi:RNA polymerase sigma-70 factor, ECF subfamily
MSSAVGSVYGGMDDRKRMFDVLGQLAALKRYARSLSRNVGDAEDLVHDALVRAYERRSTFRHGANLRNWLMSILHNTHIDRLRSSQARARRDAATMIEAETWYPAQQEHGVRLAQVRKAFDSLPKDQREALHLVAVEDLTYQEAADVLGIPVGTLMSRVSRARAALRDFEDAAKSPSHLKIVGGSHD